MVTLRVPLDDEGTDALELRTTAGYVMPPSHLSCLLAANLKIPEESVVVDLGCGCGILGIVAAKLGAKRVYAVDVNPYAIEDTLFNSKVNGVSSRMRTIKADLRDVGQLLNERVDVVISNPPQLSADVRRRNKNRWLSLSYDGGPEGNVLVDVVIAKASELLNGGGRGLLEMVTTSKVGIGRSLSLMGDYGLIPDIVARTLVPLAQKTPSSSRTGRLLCERAVVIHASKAS